MNKMDRAGANFLERCRSGKERLAEIRSPAAPDRRRDMFKGVVDLIANKAIIWHEETKGTLRSTWYRFRSTCKRCEPLARQSG